MKKILETLKNQNVKLCFIDKKTEGALYDDHHIEINADLWIVEVFLHEHYHLQFPKYSEKRITNMAIGKRERMTKEEIISLAKKIKKKLGL